MTVLVRKRPGYYVTCDGRFKIRKRGCGDWSLDAMNDDDLQEMILRKIPAWHRLFADARKWLYQSVYEHGSTPWPSRSEDR